MKNDWTYIVVVNCYTWRVAVIVWTGLWGYLVRRCQYVYSRGSVRLYVRGSGRQMARLREQHCLTITQSRKAWDKDQKGVRARLWSYVYAIVSRTKLNKINRSERSQRMNICIITISFPHLHLSFDSPRASEFHAFYRSARYTLNWHKNNRP